ncbi:hypothetical protein [Clostridium beijerinckii]|uniref:Uncharacterized protein n=1 Tax=Clostridium beijerinckii TaxID=1520 RepID=A0AAX0B9H3_CLOBE|nr:hypothetical protein [Clostridium beijerinckii]NRT92075.1 hypothetical protein [Clostridium beijerinckii]NYC71602.1 hypothetical protein [Clostridium beijerinckii]
MNESKIWKVIFYSMGIISVIVLVVCIYAMSTFSESFSSAFDNLNKSDYQNFQDIGNQLFLLYDEGYLKTGEHSGTADYDKEKPKVKTILSKYKFISSMYLVDKDVVLITFQSIDGIAIRRNNAELKKTYKATGFDGGTLSYTELIPNVFHFSAGI